MKYLTLLRSIFLALLLVFLIPISIQAGLVNIDFNTDQDGNVLGAGTVISNQYSRFFTLGIDSNGSHDVGMVFDSQSYSGGDDDLITPSWSNKGNAKNENLGNLLIISEDNDASDPDDEAGGGKFIFDFTSAITGFSMDLVDIESATNKTITLYNHLNQARVIQLSSFTGVEWGDNSINSIVLSPSNFTGGFARVNKVVFSLNTSVGVGAIAFDQEIPEPTTMLLFGAGLLGLAAFRKKN